MTEKLQQEEKQILDNFKKFIRKADKQQRDKLLAGSETLALYAESKQTVKKKTAQSG